MMSSKIELHEFRTKLAPGPVEYAVILPAGYSQEGPALPLCLVLHGGGSSRDRLVDGYQPVCDTLWAEAEADDPTTARRYGRLPNPR